MGSASGVAVSEIALETLGGTGPSVLLLDALMLWPLCMMVSTGLRPSPKGLREIEWIAKYARRPKATSLQSIEFTEWFQEML